MPYEEPEINTRKEFFLVAYPLSKGYVMLKLEESIVKY